MKTIAYFAVPIFVLLGMIVASCSPAPQQSATDIAAAWTPTHTVTPAPTSTPVPTNTPAPTSTPVPTNTSAPTNTPTIVIRPTLTPGLFNADKNGSVYKLGEQMTVVFGRFVATPDFTDNVLRGRFVIEGDTKATPLLVLIAAQNTSIGRYVGSFASEVVWKPGTLDEVRQVITADELVQLRIPIGMNPDFDSILNEIAKGNWDVLTTDLFLLPAMVGVISK